ncbi:hypothetical protein M0811_12722 [Anaeramoeba ignava]|uniref:Uncharacterized protein n=1 Tax=Anaeramoeba ignava TaxID=1746090 RepID=A0A9Q0R5F2_ANAIG|nr:hypothetical protein M0811_12722 [Anaeramoeba ignava]
MSKLKDLNNLVFENSETQNRKKKRNRKVITLDKETRTKIERANQKGWKPLSEQTTKFLLVSTDNAISKFFKSRVYLRNNSREKKKIKKIIHQFVRKINKKSNDILIPPTTKRECEKYQNVSEMIESTNLQKESLEKQIPILENLFQTFKNYEKIFDKKKKEEKKQKNELKNNQDSQPVSPLNELEEKSLENQETINIIKEIVEK